MPSMTRGLNMAFREGFHGLFSGKQSLKIGKGERDDENHKS